MNDRAGIAFGQVFGSLARERVDALAARKAQDQQAQVAIARHKLDREPLSPEKWIENEYFCGPLCRSIWDRWKEEFVDIYTRNVFEVILGGAIGSGKSTFVELMQAYSLYLLTCYGIPQRQFRGMLDTASILLMSMNVTEEKAKDSYFNSFRQLILSIPYFQNDAPLQKNLVNEMRIPSKNILCKFSGASRIAAESENLVFTVLDEVNLYDVVENSKRAIGDNRDGKHTYDAAEVVYEAAVRRMRTRYMLPAKDGSERGPMPLPCKVVPLCRETYPKSFIRRRIKEVRRLGLDAAGVSKVLEFAEWEPKPKGTYCGRKFHVRTSTLNESARILDDSEVVPLKAEAERRARERLPEDEQFRVVACPIEWKDLAEKDMPEFLRDVCGVATEAIGQFFRDKAAIVRCRRSPSEEVPADACEHPVSAMVTTLVDGAFLVRERLAQPMPLGDDDWRKINRYCRERGVEQEAAIKELHLSRWRPLAHPEVPRYAHFDIGVSQDSLGLVVSHMAGVRVLTRFDKEGRTVMVRAPVTWHDLLLRVVPPVDGQIQLRKARELIWELVSWGYKFAGFSADSFQSVEMLQEFQAQGYTAKVLSVDTSSVPYKQYRAAVQEGRVSMYPYPPLEEELGALELKRTNQVRDGVPKEKVDHPPLGCFVGETRIPLLDGTCPIIAELVDKDAWVYSSDKDGKFVPARGRGRLTRMESRLLDVVLDSGATVRCTPDHSWRLLDGSYREARNLRPGIDRLLPIKRVWPVNGGYERVVGKDGKREGLTHHLVWSALHGKIPEGNVIHHMNGVSTDNRPENLELQEKRMHSWMHTTRRHAVEPEWREKLRAGTIRFNNSERGRRLHSEAMLRTVRNRTSEEWRQSARKHQAFRRDVDMMALLRVIGNESEARRSPNSVARILGCGRNVVMRILREAKMDWDELLQCKTYLNHKVRHVMEVVLPAPIPVYDLEVLGTENFALAAGVYVHNSKDVADGAAATCSWIEDDFAAGQYFTGDEPAVVASYRGESASPEKCASEERDMFERGDYEGMFERAKQDEDY